MKVTILGSGSAYGTPMCFNDWGEVKDKNNPKNKRTRASVFMQVENKDILIDMGPDFRNQINDNNIKNIDAVFITHYHYDHVSSIPELWRAATVLNKRLFVYCSLETINELKVSFPFMFAANHRSGSDSIVWKVVDHGVPFTVGSVKFTPFGAPHHDLTSTGFRYNNFAYLTDYEDLPKETMSFLKNLDLLVIECNNGLSPRLNGHNDWFKLSNWLKELKPKRTILTHLSARIDYDELAKAVPAGVEVAYDGMILEV